MTVQGVVPVSDAQALAELAGRPLVAHAVAALLAATHVGPVLVTAPAHLAEAVADAVPPDERVRHAPPGAGVDAPLRVLHDPLHPLASAALVDAVVAALLAAPAAVGAIAVRPVTDTLKWVDDADLVRGTADRNEYRVVAAPQAYRAVVPVMAASPAALPALARALGEVLLVPAPHEVFRIAGPDELELARALVS